MADDTPTTVQVVTTSGTLAFTATKDGSNNYTMQTTPRVNGAQVDSTNPMAVSGSVAVTGTSVVSGTVAVSGTVPVSGTVALSGTETVQGVAASGSAVAGNPVLFGARAATQSPTAVTDGQAVDIMTDKIGRIINAGFAFPENNLTGFITSTVTAAATIIASPGSAVSIYLTDLEISNTSATAAVLTLSTPNSIQLLAPAGGGREVHLTTPIQLAANTALTFTTTPAVSTILVGAQGFKGA